MTRKLLYIFFFISYAISGISQLDSNNILPQQSLNSDSVELLSMYDKMIFYKELCWKSRTYNSKKALEYGFKALQLSIDLKEIEHQASILNYLGVIYRNLNNYPIALDYYLDALKLADENELIREKAYALNNIGDIHNRKENYDDAIEYISNALILFTKISDKNGMAYCNAQLGLVMRNKKDDNKALSYFLKSLEIRETQNDSIRIAIAYRRIGEIYYLKNDLENTRKYYFNSFNLLENSKDYRAICNAYLSIGKYYLKTDSLKLSKINLQKSYTIGNRHEFKTLTSESSFYLSKILSLQNKYDSAFFYLNIYKSLSDSIINANNIAKVTQIVLQHRYNKELEERKAIELKNKKQARIYYGIFIAIIIIVLTIAISLKKLNKVKQKANTALAEKNQKILEQQEELRTYYDELKEINQTKDKFFSIIAHDLKNPFNAIMGFANLIIDEYDEDDYENIRDYAQVIYNSSEQNYNLLINLLEWARSQTGNIKFQPEHIDADEIINDIIQLLSSNISEKKLVIHYEKSPKHIYADSNMVSTVVRNLLTNAIKYSMPLKNIYISVEKNSNSTEFCIRDEGTGIHSDDIGKLFKIDEDFSKPGTNKESGTGLGLILCKEFINRHKGKIWAESKLGEGSSFFFTIPNTDN